MTQQQAPTATAMISAAVAVALFTVALVVFIVPRLLGYDIRVIQTGSMEPVLSVGDMIYSDTRETPELDDIITFHGDGDTPVTHKVLAETDRGFVTYGVNNGGSIDRATAPREDVIGVYSWKISNVGRAIEWAQAHLAQIFVLTAFAAVAFPVINTLVSKRRSSTSEEGASSER